MKRIIIFLSFLLSFQAVARKPVPASRFEQLTGKKAGSDVKNTWDKIYSRSKFVYGKAPAKFLTQSFQYIPDGASVLDLGMGEGRNAVFLAQKGHKVTGVDISPIAVKKAKILAKEFGVKLQTLVADLKSYDFKENSFDTILCFYYVDRSLIDKMKKWLKPNGLIIYEAFTKKQKEKNKNESDPDSYYLSNGELLELFSGFRLLKFEEPQHQEQFTSSIIAKKE